MLSLTLVLMTGLAVGASEEATLADNAISKAIALLQEAKAKVTDPVDREKLDSAIAALQRIDQSDWESTELADFSRQPQHYKGKAVTMVLTMAKPPEEERTLRDFAGQAARFYFHDSDDKRVDLKILIPKDLKDIPQAIHLDEVEVTFVCAEGKHLEGNRAISIRKTAP